MWLGTRLMGAALAVPVEVEGPQQPAVPAAQLRPAGAQEVTQGRGSSCNLVERGRP